MIEFCVETQNRPLSPVVPCLPSPASADPGKSYPLTVCGSLRSSFDFSGEETTEVRLMTDFAYIAIILIFAIGFVLSIKK